MPRARGRLQRTTAARVARGRTLQPEGTLGSASFVPGLGSLGDYLASRYLSTASTRRWSLSTGGRRSFWKMFFTCFSTARCGDDELRRDRRVRASFGHQPEHLALPRAEVGERLLPAGAGEEL